MKFRENWLKLVRLVQSEHISGKLLHAREHIAEPALAIRTNTDHEIEPGPGPDNRRPWQLSSVPDYRNASYFRDNAQIDVAALPSRSLCGN